MKCEYCEVAKGKIKSEVVYEDKEVIAWMKDMAAFPGQVCVMPKEHFTILELVPDLVVDKVFKIANKISIAIFESLGVQGTNIVVQNGTAAGQKVPHFCVEIIPRKEGDNLNLDWKPKNLMDDEMDTAYLMLKEESEQLVVGQDKPIREVLKDEKTEMIVEKDGEENYMLKQLRRVP